MALLEGKGIVFASRNRVLVFHEGMATPVSLVERGSARSEDEVTSLLFYQERLFDAGHSGLVYETLTSEPVLTARLETNPLYGLVDFGGDIVALEQAGGHSDPVARIFRLLDNHTLTTFKSKEGHPNVEKDLSYRPDSLDLAVAGSDLYVASENVVQVSGSSINKLTDYTSDFVHLASNGETVVAVSYHNPKTHPRGAEVRRMPDNKLLASWDYDRFGDGGYHGLVALYDDVLLFGSAAEKTNNNLYGFRITSEMNAAPEGVEVTPELVLPNAFDRSLHYGSGNPLLVISRDELGRLLANRM